MSDAPPPAAARPPGWRAYVGLTVGVVLLAGLTLAVGWRPVLAAALSVGAPGFAGICLAWLGVLVLLGGAWMLAAPDARAGSLGAFAWARTVREAAADLLPFSQVGGLVFGANAAAAAAGLSLAAVWASLVVDLTTEMAAQLAYTLGGVAGLGWRLTRAGAGGGAGQELVVWGGLALTAAGAAVTALFVVLQRRGVGWAAGLASRWLPGAVAGAASIQAELDRAYARPWALLASTAAHGAGWIASGLVSWWMLQLMGAPLPLVSVLVVESLLAAAKSFGFAIPGALGVQEAAYALIGPLFGLPPQTALGLSLLKRARDLAVGAPVLVLWRWGEGRRIARALRTSPAP